MIRILYSRQVELMTYQQTDHVQGQVHLSNVVCNGNERDIKACGNVQWNTQCTQNEFIEIACCKHFSITLKFHLMAYLIG